MPRHRSLVQLPPEVVAEIKRQRLLKVFENREPIWKDTDHPEMQGDSDNWIRQMRAESEARFQSLQFHSRD